MTSIAQSIFGEVNGKGMVLSRDNGTLVYTQKEKKKSITGERLASKDRKRNKQPRRKDRALQVSYIESPTRLGT